MDMTDYIDDAEQLAVSYRPFHFPIVGATFAGYHPRGTRKGSRGDGQRPRDAGNVS